MTNRQHDGVEIGSGSFLRLFLFGLMWKVAFVCSMPLCSAQPPKRFEEIQAAWAQLSSSLEGYRVEATRSENSFRVIEGIRKTKSNRDKYEIKASGKYFSYRVRIEENTLDPSQVESSMVYCLGPDGPFSLRRETDNSKYSIIALSDEHLDPDFPSRFLAPTLNLAGIYSATKFLSDPYTVTRVSPGENEQDPWEMEFESDSSPDESRREVLSGTLELDPASQFALLGYELEYSDGAQSVGTVNYTEKGIPNAKRSIQSVSDRLRGDQNGEFGMDVEWSYVSRSEGAIDDAEFTLVHYGINNSPPERRGWWLLILLGVNVLIAGIYILNRKKAVA